MRSLYLEAARQGRNHPWRYLLTSLVVIAALAISVILAALLMVGYGFLSTRIPVDQIDFDQIAEQEPTIFYVLIGWVLFALSASLLWAEEKIHRRPLRGLLSVEGIVRLRRVRQAVLMWIGLRVVSTLIIYLFTRSAFTWAGRLWEWLAYAPMILALSLASALAIALLLGCLMRGLGLLLSNPLVLAVIFSFAFCALAIVTAETNSALGSIGSFIQIFFMLFLILREESTELILGYLTADIFYSLAFAVSDDPFSLPVVFVLDSASFDSNPNGKA